jgi:hypothetical protein
MTVTQFANSASKISALDEAHLNLNLMCVSSLSSTPCQWGSQLIIGEQGNGAFDRLLCVGLSWWFPFGHEKGPRKFIRGPVLVVGDGRVPISYKMPDFARSHEGLWVKAE